MNSVQAGTWESVIWCKKPLSLRVVGSMACPVRAVSLTQRYSKLSWGGDIAWAQPFGSRLDLIRLEVKIFGSPIQRMVLWFNDSWLILDFGMEIWVHTKQNIHSCFGGDHPASHFILNSPFATWLFLPLIIVFSWLLVQGGVYGAIKFHSFTSNKKCWFLLELHFH